MSFLLIEKKDALAVITINRPEKLNALNHAVLKELENTIMDLEADTAVGIIILTGSGDKSFVAGADIGEMQSLKADEGRRMALKGQSVFGRIAMGSKPVIAAVNGFALGGGCELALSCHLRFASEKARFALPEVSLGLIPGYGGTQRLPRLIGKGLALDMILSGEMINAQDALRMGLVSRVFPHEVLLDETRKVAEIILSRGPQAVGLALRAVNQGLDMSLRQGLEHEASLFGLLVESPEAHEGTAAFIEKRKPLFKRS